MEQALILAANRKTLDLISPNDASAIISFEKLENELLSLNGAFDIPLLIGELTPLSSASDEINMELRNNSVTVNFEKTIIYHDEIVVYQTF